ncbi:MAG: ABC transporter permease [Chloroflexi bacterium]|nr:ABC transporter permease [Chloroflexota bacterium]
MMKVWDLARKDLLQTLRDRNAALFLVLMPLLFTVFFGFMFAGSGGEGDDPRLPLGVVNHDSAGALGSALQTLLEKSGTVRTMPLEGEAAAEAETAVSEGRLAAALVVPAGFGAAHQAGQPIPLTLIGDPAAASGRSARTAVQAALSRLMGAWQAAELSAAAYDAQAGFADEAARQGYRQEALAAALAAWQRPPLEVAVVPAGTPAEAGKSSAYAHSSSGMMVMFVLYGLLQSAMVLVVERKTGALRRLLTTPISRAEVLAGHMLAMFLVSLGQQALLVGFGQLVLGIDYLREPLALLLVTVTLSLWVASLGLFIGAVAAREEHVIILSLAASMALGALGGAMFPLEGTGKTFSAIGHLTPTAWAVDGFQNITMRGLGLSSAWLPAAVLLAYAAAFFGLAVWRFRFE